MAAAGWLGLKCPDDALAELDALSPENRRHPDALELRWLAQAEGQDWSGALATATELVQTTPERPTGWLHRAYAMRRAPEGGLQKAWELLLPAVERFPKESVIAYNLACYACQRDQLDESRHWLYRALALGTREDIKQMALQDEDLRRLWDEIEAL
jgi:Tfp pilus assembly protein PilF